MNDWMTVYELSDVEYTAPIQINKQHVKWYQVLEAHESPVHQNLHKVLVALIGEADATYYWLVTGEEYE